MAKFSIALLEAALQATVDGVVIAKAGKNENPIIYVNPAFEALTGYSAAEIIGHDCRFLNKNLGDQIGLVTLREHIRYAVPCRVLLHNQKKNGELFWNEFSLSPVFDANKKLTHFVGVQKDVTERVQQERDVYQHNQLLAEKNQQLETLAIRDPLTGLYNRRYFNEQLGHLCSMHSRLDKPIGVAFIDIDHYKAHNDTFGHLEGDKSLRLIAKAISKHFSRDSDIVARYGGDEFVIATSLEKDIPHFINQLEKLRKSIVALGIQFRSNDDDALLSGSIGAYCNTPTSKSSPALFIAEADNAMYQAKRNGGNCIVQADVDYAENMEEQL
jgi:diguanylate cyclase (GGDEF)-like protein/PAS domain S-box-containing protein